ncbi:hypothetical protein [Dechloromonas sp. ZS-1]|uniref:hypothetical protein n=1 Tax=Dechloromonas sp. ZS-1 TaxID=3138067 RepID=UPI0031FD9122
MRRFAGACRFVFNQAVLQKTMTQARFIGYVVVAKHLTAWRNGKETPKQKDAPVHPLQHALKDLQRAYFPRFKKKGPGDSFLCPDPQQFKLDVGNRRIFLP